MILIWLLLNLLLQCIILVQSLHEHLYDSINLQMLLLESKFYKIHFLRMFNFSETNKFKTHKKKKVIKAKKKSEINCFWKFRTAKTKKARI